MNLLKFRLAYKSINRTVSSEAKRIAWQAWLWLKKMASESYVKLFFGYLVRDVLRDLLFGLWEYMK